MKNHMSTDDRIQIEIMLKQKEALSKIAERIGKSKSTISREIRKHAIDSQKSAAYRIPNRCTKRYEFKKSGVCPDEECTQYRMAKECHHCKR